MDERRPIVRLFGPAIMLAAALTLTPAGSARAGETAEPSGGFWSGVLEKLDLKTRTTPMPDFVQATHPDPSRMTFIPTGPVPRKQAVPVKSTDDIEAAKQALDAAQAGQLSANPEAVPSPPPAPVAPPPPKQKAKPVKSAAAKSKLNPQSE